MRRAGREAKAQAPWRPGGRTTDAEEDAGAGSTGGGSHPRTRARKPPKKVRPGTGFRPRVPSDSFVKQRHPEWDFRKSRSRSARKKKKDEDEDDDEDTRTPADTSLRMRRRRRRRKGARAATTSKKKSQSPAQQRRAAAAMAGAPLSASTIRPLFFDRARALLAQGGEARRKVPRNTRLQRKRRVAQLRPGCLIVAESVAKF